MTKGQKIALICLLIVALAIAAIFLYPKFKEKQEKERKIIYNYSIYFQAMQREGRCEEAITETTKFLEEHGNVVDIWLIKAGCQFDLGKFDDAKATYEKILKMDPDNIPAKNHLAIFSTGATIINKSNEDQFRVSKEDFESKVKIKMDPKLLKFTEANKHSTGEGLNAFITAIYSQIGSETKVKDSLKKELKAHFLNNNITTDQGHEKWQIKVDPKHYYTITFLGENLTFDYVELK